jgi:hypothetical protein
MKAIKIEDHIDGQYYSVLVKNKKIEVWMDISIEHGDVDCDWNQYIFFQDNIEDMKIKKFQENSDNFEKVSDVAVDALEKYNKIQQLDDGSWIDLRQF